MQVKKEMDRYPKDEAMHEELKKIMRNFYLILERESYLPMQQLIDIT